MPRIPQTLSDWERRRSSRFPIELKLYYETLGLRAAVLAGHGRTVNLSSSGILFISDQYLSIGTRLEVCIDWPVRLSKLGSLCLIARGRVTRHHIVRGQAVLEIQQHEFRPQGHSAT